MKKAAGLIFAAALVVIPGLTLARSNPLIPYLGCSAVYPTVSLGNTGRFNVVSNASGPFMWVVSSEDYGVYNAGAQFITPFTHLGTQKVDVVWGTQRASCFVNVVAAPGFGEPYTGPALAHQNPDAYYPSAYGPGPNVTLASAAYPALPNAGFEPQTLAAFAFALVLLMGAGIALYPHARKAFAVVSR